MIHLYPNHMKPSSPIQRQKALAENYRLRAKNLKAEHPDKDLQREHLLAQAELCELKAQNLNRATTI